VTGRETDQFIPHGPGPPQRPQVPGGVDDDLPLSLATAKTLRARCVDFEPHLGQGDWHSAAADFTRRSKRVWHFSQVYSKIGMSIPYVLL